MTDRTTLQVEKIRACIHAELDRPFRVITQQLGHVKVRYRGLAKNTAQLEALFALSKLWPVREKVLALDGQVRLRAA